ncbi:hypothetical protein AMECASPLE_012278 [Ameca splendens]|uniref:Uncharacterized protein n=1 Tax=Ameca splendens TaxID=208324 RepID=A0ABV0ZKS4_9TELE
MKSKEPSTQVRPPPSLTDQARRALISEADRRPMVTLEVLQICRSGERIWCQDSYLSVTPQIWPFMDVEIAWPKGTDVVQCSRCFIYKKDVTKKIYTKIPLRKLIEKSNMAKINKTELNCSQLH